MFVVLPGIGDDVHDSPQRVGYPPHRLVLAWDELARDEITHIRLRLPKELRHLPHRRAGVDLPGDCPEDGLHLVDGAFVLLHLL